MTAIYSKTPLVILGASSLAREFYWYLRPLGYTTFIFVDDLTTKNVFEIDGANYPLVNNWNFKPYINLGDLQFIVSIGNPIIKKMLVQKALDAGLKPAPTIVCPNANIYGKDNKLGVGGIIAPGCNLTTNITLGDYVILNLNCTVGHDSILEDYVTCNPGCHISGYVTIKEQTVLGTGTIIRDSVSVAERNIIGAQAAVCRSIEDVDGVYGGVPVKKLKIR